MKLIKCPYCGKDTALQYAEFTLTYCEQCGNTYGAERRKNEMIIFKVEEAYRFEIT